MGDPYRGFINPFPVARPIASTQTFPTPFLIVAFDPRFGYPNIHQWNFTTEQSVSKSMVARVAYQGSAGRSIFHAAELNPAIYGPGATLSNTDQRGPRPEFTQISFAGTFGRSNYNALVMSFERRFSGGLTFLAGYSWQKSLDLLSNTAFEGNGNAYPLNGIDRDYAVSNFDRTGRFTGSVNYVVPSRKGGLLYLIGGWQMNAIVSLQTGGPLNITAGIDNSRSGIGQDRVNVVGNPDISGERSRGDKIKAWFNTAAFAPNALGTFGTLGRNTGHGPGVATVDGSIFKNFAMPFSENHRLEFRAEGFNLFNRVNVNNPTTTRSSSLFGRITSAGDPRILQLGLRYAF